MVTDTLNSLSCEDMDNYIKSIRVWYVNRDKPKVRIQRLCLCIIVRERLGAENYYIGKDCWVAVISN